MLQNRWDKFSNQVPQKRKSTKRLGVETTNDTQCFRADFTCLTIQTYANCPAVAQQSQALCFSSFKLGLWSRVRATPSHALPVLVPSTAVLSLGPGQPTWPAPALTMAMALIEDSLHKNPMAYHHVQDQNVHVYVIHPFSDTSTYRLRMVYPIISQWNPNYLLNTIKWPCHELEPL